MSNEVRCIASYPNAERLPLPPVHTFGVRSLVASFLFSLALHAGAQDSKQIDAFVNQLMEKRGVPGVSLAVVKNGKVVYAKGYGFAALENKVPAAVVMQLVQEGKLKLDEKVRVYMPELPEAWKQVTVRHLLTHTSGIPSYTDSPEFWKHARDPASAGDFLSLVGSAKLDFEPGTEWKYDN